MDEMSGYETFDRDEASYNLMNGEEHTASDELASSMEEAKGPGMSALSGGTTCLSRYLRKR